MDTTGIITLLQRLGTEYQTVKEALDAAQSLQTLVESAPRLQQEIADLQGQADAIRQTMDAAQTAHDHLVETLTTERADWTRRLQAQADADVAALRERTATARVEAEQAEERAAITKATQQAELAGLATELDSARATLASVRAELDTLRAKLLG